MFHALAGELANKHDTARRRRAWGPRARRIDMWTWLTPRVQGPMVDGRWSRGVERGTLFAFGVIQRIRWSMVEGGVITVMAVKPTSCQGM